MVEKGRTGSSETTHPLIKKVLTSKPPIAELIGFNVEEISDGRAVGCLQSGPQHANPMGTLHGGVLCDVADAAMGMAFASTFPRMNPSPRWRWASISSALSGKRAYGPKPVSSTEERT